MTIIIFVIILAVLILVHEFGHFITAKKAGMKVKEFGIGFPPKLLSFKPKKSETTYSFNVIPFGGFVKILGEDRDEDISPEEIKRSFGKKSALKRSLVLVAGVTANFILAWLLIAAALSMGTPASTAGINEQYIKDPSLTITGVMPGSPAEEAGFMPGDKVLFAERVEESIQNPTEDELSTFIRESGGMEISILVQREENHLLKVVPEEGIVEGQFAIGVGLNRVGFAKVPFYKALPIAFLISLKLVWFVFLGIIGFIVNAFQGAAGLNQVTGPVGIAGLVGDSLAIGLSSLFSFTALISLHLAVLNLIPFPALDGGRLLFILIEKIKGSKVNPKIENWVNGIGFALLIILMIIVTYNDIVRLF